jgi:hypothetical protein
MLPHVYQQTALSQLIVSVTALAGDQQLLAASFDRMLDTHLVDRKDCRIVAVSSERG